MQFLYVDITDYPVTREGIYQACYDEVVAEAIENKGSEGTIGTIHNRILDVHYQNSDGVVPVQEVAHRHFRKDLDLL